MSADRVVYSMVLGWVVLSAALIVLDWLGNPNRGSFRPKGDRDIRDRKARRADRRRRRLESDAAVRATLRDAYGASSMRLSWSSDKEFEARMLDDALIVRDLDERVGVVDVGSRDVTTVDYTVVEGDPLPNPTESPPPEPGRHDAEGLSGLDVDDDIGAHSECAPGEDPAAEERDAPARPVGWRVGVDPLALTRRGTEPSAATVRARVWKNLATTSAWDDDNLERLRAGKPPRRRNPVTGRTERAVVDTDTGRASWGSEPVDPFGSRT